MTIVVDVGCARYGADYSIERLIEEFKPDFLFGFDPNWSPEMFIPGDDLKTLVDITTAAAWTYDGEIGFHSDGLNSWLSDESGRKSPCIDLARWMWEEMPAVRLTDAHKHKIILKVDAEGSEYDLLEHLIAEGANTLVDFAWIEWHDHGAPRPALRRRHIERSWGKPIAEWRF